MSTRLLETIVGITANPQVAVVQLLTLMEAYGGQTNGEKAIRALLSEARSIGTQEAAVLAMSSLLAAAAGGAELLRQDELVQRFRTAMRDRMEAGATQQRADA